MDQFHVVAPLNLETSQTHHAARQPTGLAFSGAIRVLLTHDVEYLLVEAKKVMLPSLMICIYFAK